MNQYDILLGCDKSRATSVVARGVPGYQAALYLRRFRLLQFRARQCNIDIKHGGVVDTPGVSQCTLCPSSCQTTLRRVK